VAGISRILLLTSATTLWWLTSLEHGRTLHLSTGGIRLL